VKCLTCENEHEQKHEEDQVGNPLTLQQKKWEIAGTFTHNTPLFSHLALGDKETPMR
jgi:hypothetical protein